jgi:hypothetical protein
MKSINLNIHVIQLQIKFQQAHKVCVGQNELVLSLLEDFKFSYMCYHVQS